ncbi:MAG: hypothetical protein ACM3UT_09135 [Chloroflexota bacterium]
MKKQAFFSVALMFVMTLSLNAQKTVDFTYRYPVKPVSYTNSENIHQTLDIQGQSMDVYVSGFMACNVRAAGNNGNKVNVTVTVDTLAQTIDSPQGVMGGGISEAKGKAFDLVLMPNGKVADISGAKNTTYTIPGQGPGNFSTSFADFFPVLPSGKVSQGYTWTSVDTVSTDTGPNTQVTIINAENKFEGFEEVNGVNCAKITSASTGTSNMRNQVQGMDMRTTGNFTGNSTTYFSPESGYFIKSVSNIKMTGNVEMPNEGYSFPVVIDIVETTETRK